MSARSIKRMKAANLHPIVIFLRPANEEVVKLQNPTYDSKMVRTVCELAGQVWHMVWLMV